MMSESEQKPQHTTVQVGVKSDPGQRAGDGIQLDINYFKTFPGIIKIAEIVVGILCMALGSPGWTHSYRFFLFVAVSAFIGTILWTFFYFLSLRSALPQLPINWTLSELLFTVVYTILYLIAFIVELAEPWNVYGRGGSRYIAAGVFGILNTIAYGLGSFFLYRDHKFTVTTTAAT